MKQRANYRKIIGLLFLSFCLLCSICACQNKNTNSSSKDKSLTIHYLDVGQGNAILAESDGHFMLIDGGEREYSSFVVSYLKQQGVTSLDYMIATHYDSDHLNGVIGALHAFDTDTLFAPDYSTDTRTYTSFLGIAKEKKLTKRQPKPGEEFVFGSCTFTIVCPVKQSYEEENNYSIGIRLVCGKNSFLFLGDAETESEQDMLNAHMNVQADVYLVSHHGSVNSSLEEFLDAVNPSYAVISCGENSYGHPADSTLKRLNDRNITVFRTDTQGTILAKSDGESITFSTQKTDHTAFSYEEKNSYYIGNLDTYKFHLPNCSGLPAEHNRIFFETRKEALDAGYEPCKKCHP